MVRTDDQAVGSFNSTYMPKTFRFFEQHGTVFTNSIVSTPLCCPSRAQSLTGQYAHNNGILGNSPGYPALLDDRNVLPNWLRSSGYRTIHIGKWLHGYPEAHKLKPAPGWDRWLTANWARYYGATFSIDGELRTTPGYFGDVLAGMASRSIHRYAPGRKPFFLQIDEFAPHLTFPRNDGARCDGGAIPAERDAGLFADAAAPRTAAFNEPDVSDKPEHMRAIPQFGVERTQELDRQFGCAMASLRSVDRNFAALVRGLREEGELGQTLIVFTSDNGFTYGGHRMAFGKGLPYDEHIRVPLAVAMPRGHGDAPLRIRAASANVDLPATFLELAGAKPCFAGACRRLDGRSLVPLLEGRRPGWAKDRAIRTSFDAAQYRFYTCAWDGYWTPAESVTVHTLLPDAAGECRPATVWEAYDLRTDPLQLDAREPTLAQQRRLERLVSCTGIRGREPALPGRAFCE
jgi:N-acetylglucosamine-6-sulfatase